MKKAIDIEKIMSKLPFDQSLRWEPFSEEDLKLAKHLEEKYKIRLLFNEHKLTWYCGKWVKITSPMGVVILGRVSDYVHPEDNPTRTQGIIVDIPDGTRVELFERDIKDIEEFPETFKVRYISDKKSIFFKKGEVYEAFLPKDNQSGSVYAFYLGEMDEPGDYALPASRFEVLDDDKCRR